jgi:hypothetical protein
MFSFKESMDYPGLDKHAFYISHCFLSLVRNFIMEEVKKSPDLFQ